MGSAISDLGYAISNFQISSDLINAESVCVPLRKRSRLYSSHASGEDDHTPHHSFVAGGPTTYRHCTDFDFRLELSQPAGSHCGSTESGRLPQNLAVLNEGFSFSRTEGGRTSSPSKRKRTLDFRTTRTCFADVEVIVYGEKDGDPERRVVSDECSYDAETLDFRFVGQCGRTAG